MKNLLLIALSLLCITAQAQLNTATALKLSPEKKGTVAMSWEQESHDFGSLTIGADATYTFIVKNTGDADLELTSVKPSCSCTVANYTKTPIAPGETGFVTANYKTTKAGVFSKTVTVQTNAEQGPIVLRLRGEVAKKEM
ncbi:MAG: DUF1573 domain-containing protein [Bacteroidota bacterium]